MQNRGLPGGRNRGPRSEEPGGPIRAAQPEAARCRGLPGVRERRRRVGRAEGAMLSRAGIRARPGLGLLQVRGTRAGGEGTGRAPRSGGAHVGKVRVADAVGAGRRDLGWGHQEKGNGVEGLGAVGGNWAGMG